DPILVFCDETDVRMLDLPLSHSIGPVVYLDPPLAAIRAAQVPLISSVHTLCFCRLKIAAHGIEHFLRRRIHMAGRSRACCDEANRHSSHTERQKQAVFSSSMIGHFVIPSSFSRPYCSIRLKRKVAPRNVITAPAKSTTRSLT